MTTLSRISRILVAAGAAALVVLVVTGVWLARYYQPWADFEGVHLQPAPVGVMVTLHRIGAGALLLATAVLLGVRLGSAARHAVPAALVVLSGAALVVTGRRLRWSQLALWTVRPDADPRGMLFAAFDSSVRFILTPGFREVDRGFFRLLLGLHAVVLPLVVVGALVVERRIQRARERPTAAGT